MHILVIDDEQLARQRLRRMLEARSDCEVVGEAENGIEGLRLVHELDPDLVLLDVRMPGKDGLDVARELSSLAEPPAIVFCTAYDDYALQAFETFAQGYIVKPVQDDQLNTALQRVRTLTRAQLNQRKAASAAECRRSISAKTHRGISLIPVEDIACFVADQKYVSIVHGEQTTLIDETLKELETEFANHFVRVHRNALVAVNKIVALERDGTGQAHLRLDGCSQQPIVSRRHMRALRERLHAR